MKNKTSWEIFIEQQKSLSNEFHKKTSMHKISQIKNWPKSWTQIHFKRYPRFKNISLVKPNMFVGSLWESIIQRKSQRDFNNYKISEIEISNLLYFGSGITTSKIIDWDKTTRTYPSAGGRYPLEVYAAIFNSEKINKGLYHYNTQNHSLEILINKPVKKDILAAMHQNWVGKSSIVFIVTSIINRSRIKYADRAYRYSLIEAGHIAQNISLIATALGLGSCAIGGFIDSKLNTLLDIDDEQEFAVYTLAIGK